jgi:hypothetical protein
LIRTIFGNKHKIENYLEKPNLFIQKGKNIDLHDSAITYNNVKLDQIKQTLNSKSKSKIPKKIVSRNPFQKLDGINYDIDSEDEFDDMQGEALNLDEDSEDSEQNASDLYEEGFIVNNDDFDALSETSYEDFYDGEKIPINEHLVNIDKNIK